MPITTTPTIFSTITTTKVTTTRGVTIPETPKTTLPPATTVPTLMLAGLTAHTTAGQPPIAKAAGEALGNLLNLKILLLCMRPRG